MSDLLKQAEECLSKPCEMHSEHEKALYVLRDCVTEIERLSKPYVPMADDEAGFLDKIAADSEKSIYTEQGTIKPRMFARLRTVEAAFIKRAGLEIKHD